MKPWLTATVFTVVCIVVAIAIIALAYAVYLGAK